MVRTVERGLIQEMTIRMYDEDEYESRYEEIQVAVLRIVVLLARQSAVLADLLYGKCPLIAAARSHD